MKGTAEIPMISVVENEDSGLFTLYAHSYGSLVVAGPRLFRAPPHPDISFQHLSKSGAETDAGKLRAYLEAARKGGPSKAKQRSQHD